KNSSWVCKTLLITTPIRQPVCMPESTCGKNKRLRSGRVRPASASIMGQHFADQTIANMMSESVFPVMLHQDPRYFPLAKGGFWKRPRYAISREWITRNDSGKNTFNTSELGGNAAAVAISNAYYPSENRNVSDNAYKYGQQIGLDAFFNVLKEFWPDMRNKMFGK